MERVVKAAILNAMKRKTLDDYTRAFSPKDGYYRLNARNRSKCTVGMVNLFLSQNVKLPKYNMDVVHHKLQALYFIKKVLK